MLDRVLDGKYRLTRLIGEGGMGSVYEAEHQRIHRQVAVKLMRQGAEGEAASVERFHREAMAASAIGHPNIVEIFDVGLESDGTAFIVMELLRGTSLAALLKLEGVVVPGRAMSFALQVLSALDAAHRKGIIHRDLKPDNVFVSVDRMMREVVKILDFGVAKIQGTPERDLELTKSGVVFGSPYYLSPEQARGRRDLDPRVDIWAAGVILYQMLGGKRPFDGENYNEILGRILMDEPIPVLALAPEIPVGLARVVERALAKDREQRYGSAAEMLEALLEFHEPSPDEMNTQVIRVLGQRDDHRPPELDPRFRVLMPDDRLSSAPRTPSAPRRSDPLSETMPSGPLPDLSGRRSASRRRWLVPGVLAVALGAAGWIAGAVFLDGREGAGDGVGPGAADAGTRAEARPPRPVEDAGPPVPEVVLITFAGLPGGAEIAVDGRPALPPLALPRSDAPVVLRVTAPGHAPLDKAVVPDRDREIPVELVPLPVDARADSGPAPDGEPADRGRGRVRQRGKDATSGAEDGAWADNPFR